jgi:hypothetical protein
MTQVNNNFPSVLNDIQIKHGYSDWKYLKAEILVRDIRESLFNLYRAGQDKRTNSFANNANMKELGKQNFEKAKYSSFSINKKSHFTDEEDDEDVELEEKFDNKKDVSFEKSPKSFAATKSNSVIPSNLRWCRCCESRASHIWFDCPKFDANKLRNQDFIDQYQEHLNSKKTKRQIEDNNNSEEVNKKKTKKEKDK